MDRVKAEGYKAIVLTADATVGGNREVDKRNGFVFPSWNANCGRIPS